FGSVRVVREGSGVVDDGAVRMGGGALGLERPGWSARAGVPEFGGCARGRVRGLVTAQTRLRDQTHTRATIRLLPPSGIHPSHRWLSHTDSTLDRSIWTSTSGVANLSAADSPTDR